MRLLIHLAVHLATRISRIKPGCNVRILGVQEQLLKEGRKLLVEDASLCPIAAIYVKPSE
jgi:hypothetical protein